MPYKKEYDSSNGIYRAVMVHEGLNKNRVIRGYDPDFVLMKAEQQEATWAEQWRKKQRKEDAAQKTHQAQEAIGAIRSTLQCALRTSDKTDWEDLKDNSAFPKPQPVKDTSPFPKPKPSKQPAPPAPPKPAVPPEPKRGDPKYLRMQRPGFLDKLSRTRRKEKMARAQRAYEWDIAFWRERVSDARAHYQRQTREHRQRITAQKAEYSSELRRWKDEHTEFVAKQEAKYSSELRRWKDEHTEFVAKQEAKYASELRRWQQEHTEFLTHQEEANTAIDRLKNQYFHGSSEAMTAYCEIVLTRSQYPDTFPQEFELDYIPSSQTLIVEYALPTIEDVPSLKEVKYIQSRDDFSELFLSERELKKLYDNLLYQIALRTVYELYDADALEALQSIVFNGWVTSTDKATGQETTACIMSLQTTREELMEVNLADVDPKACFKHLKGVGSSQLHSLTPIAPVQTISREDPRFVSSYDVSEVLDDSYNLAAMDWEDFEHLIRELFEEEFVQSGGEVRVTQASRDRGVDAVAFDPDPIRGGKTVIQAKRYTNTVGVSAVRDLYGTVMNEGATKGILVTTADYGPDAYQFAKGKPLTLLNGNNLLQLLDNHGHKAKIDLKEAKQILAEEEREQRGT